jgi:hypothetical protein
METGNGNITFNTSISKIKEVVDLEINKFLNYLVSEYKLDLNCKDVIEKRKRKETENIDLSILETEREKEIEKKKRPINPVDYCLARKPNSNQCTRIKKIDCDYCASHQYIRPFGRIDDNQSTNTNNSEIITNTNKLIINQFKIKEKKRMVKLKPIKIENTDYFIDDKNNLYIYLAENQKYKYKYIGLFENNKIKIDIKN